MHSRAHLLIERQLHCLTDTDSKPWGINASPLSEDNLFEWVAKIQALNGSIWEGGVFRLYIKFSEHYSMRPPTINFHTIPFHPNVDMMTGHVCVDFLDDWSLWNPNYSMIFILLTVQAMLSNPVLENAINGEAVRMLLISPHSYQQMVQDCVTASQRVSAGLAAHPDEKPPAQSSSDRISFGLSGNPVKVIRQPPIVQAVHAKVAKLSFDNYYETWLKIATSQSKNCIVALASGESQFKENNRQKTHPSQQKTKATKAASMEPNSDSELAIVKGSAQEEKLACINHMRKIYLQPRNTPRSKTKPSKIGNSDAPRLRDEAWEEEVDELVDWSAQLNTEVI